MKLRYARHKVKRLAAELAKDQHDLESGLRATRTGLERGAREPATLAWLFAAGTLYGATQGGDNPRETRASGLRKTVRATSLLVALRDVLPV